MMISEFTFFYLLISSIMTTFCPMKYWAIADTPTSPGNETDQLALLAFKAHITHDPLQVLNSWNSSLHFCKWHGVTCGRRHQRVVELDLMSHRLVGSLSPYIGNLSFLHYMNLSNNSFNGEIPSEVGRLLRIKEIKLNNNSFIGEIPISLSNCSDLRVIHLGYNKLTGTIPNELASLTKLVTLFLLNNNLTGTLPRSFGNFSNLENFAAASNNLHGSIPQSLGQVKSLRILHLSINMFSSMVPPSIYNLSSLQFFSITGNKIYGTLPRNIGLTLPNIEMFLIAANQFYGTIPTSLFNCSKLRILGLSHNNFTGQVPTKVGNLKYLQKLNLFSNQLGSGQIEDLKFISSMINCSSLRILEVGYNKFGGILHNTQVVNFSSQLNELWLGSNQISGSIPFEIENLVNLTLLDLGGNKLTGNIPVSIGKLQNLQKFNLAGNNLSAQIPTSIFNLSQLFYLNLESNYFEGGLSPTINNCQALQEIYLSKNKLNGIIPSHLFSLSQLIFVSLSDNSFTGSLPNEVGNLKYLIGLDVSNNMMTGKIPSTLGSCLSMEELNLSGNSLQGPIPPTFMSLKGLQALDLSRNNLYGQIPTFLQNLSNLQYLNLSVNNLEGEVPTNGVFQNASAFSILGNNKLCGGIQQLHLPPCPLNKKSKTRKMSLALKVSLGVTLLSIIMFASFLSIFLYWRRRRPTKKPTSKHFWEDHFKKVSYQELHQATNGFSPTNLIGNGSFGVVYKGILQDQDERPWAIKVLNLIERSASKTFKAECEALRKVRHRNLLKILTVCSSMDFEGNDFKALIFQFMPNGSLENWLHPTSNGRNQPGNLNLLQRINIAIDIASALDYLHNHCETPIVHCDLKPSNVLLNEEMVAHVGDFGLAKLLHKSSTSFDEKETSSIHAKGTIGYIPPEYGMGDEASTQGDVYSYGILLLEMITGKKPTNDMFEEGLDLHHFCSTMASSEQVMKIIDQRMLLDDQVNQIILVRSESLRDMKDKVQECLTSIARVGVACSMKSPSERLDIKDALKELLSVKQLYLQIMMQGQRGKEAN